MDTGTGMSYYDGMDDEPENLTLSYELSRRSRAAAFAWQLDVHLFAVVPPTREEVIEAIEVMLDDLENP